MMFKTVHNKLWAFDCEWVPDPLTGRGLYKLPESMSDTEVMKEMWKAGGATEENPMPYLKTVLCRVVSISAVVRTAKDNGIQLQLLSLPRNTSDPALCRENAIIETFLDAIGKNKPQLVGYNSAASDLKILIQRGIANGIQASEFCRRPEKPWEGVDYFARGSDFQVDLMDIVGSWGKGAPSLNEMAVASGIPGKLEVDGNAVAPLWLDNQLDQIVAYNEYDAVTTYLLWLRTAHFGGFLTSREYEEEQGQMKELLLQESEKPERGHFQIYLDEWSRLA